MGLSDSNLGHWLELSKALMHRCSTGTLLLPTGPRLLRDAKQQPSCHGPRIGVSVTLNLLIPCWV